MSAAEEVRPRPGPKQAAARLAFRGLLGLTAISDVLPAHIRFGHWQKVLSLLRPRVALPALERRQDEATPESYRPAAKAPVGERHSCLLIAGALDGGGVEAVVSTLALGLPGEGFDVEVVTTREGRTSAALAAAGVPVTGCSPCDLAELIAQRRPDVLELHRPDPSIVSGLLGSVAPVVPVFHAMESYLNADAWALLREVIRTAPSCIAVSEGVREFVSGHAPGARISVVVNGVAPLDMSHVPTRTTARASVGAAAGAHIADDDILVVALQRYSDQKNAAGLVDAFLAAAERETRLRLVMAGSPDNWLEFRRADLLRRGTAAGRRVHLLGDSDAQALLAAGDVYALGSFAEGGPLTAVEAVMHGLPVVLSDVGFSRVLVSQDGVAGEVVARANAGFAERDLAAQRRRVHQHNREEFAAALLRVSSCGRGAVGRVPAVFTEASMVSGHAAVLRAALGARS